MFATVFFTSLFILQYIHVISQMVEVLPQVIESDLPNDVTKPPEVIKIGVFTNTDKDPELDKVNDVQKMQFQKGIVPYFIDPSSYDSLITTRIQEAMDVVEASSCVVFNQMEFMPTDPYEPWLHFVNPTEKRDCVHEPIMGDYGEIVIVIGFDCMSSSELLHAVLHAIGFKDEVSHPHRDQYIRILWENIQPRYRNLFRMQYEDAPYKVVEYDPMSIMHFHDRAFSINGGPTIAPRVPGLLIAPSDKLSQLDVMKLRLWFGHECNKRKVGALLEKCKTVFHNNPTVLGASNYYNDQSVEADNDNDSEFVASDGGDSDDGDGDDGGNGDDMDGGIGGDGGDDGDGNDGDGNGGDGSDGADGGEGGEDGDGIDGDGSEDGDGGDGGDGIDGDGIDDDGIDGDGIDGDGGEDGDGGDGGDGIDGEDKDGGDEEDENNAKDSDNEV